VRVQFKHAHERLFGLVNGADGLHSSVRKLAFGPQDRFEKRLGYAIAAFEVGGYRPRDDDVYVIYGEPGRMLGRFALHDDRTLFLFVFADDVVALPGMFDLSAQKAMLRERFGGGKWECPRILSELDRTQSLYFDRVSQIKMETWSKLHAVAKAAAHTTSYQRDEEQHQGNHKHDFCYAYRSSSDTAKAQHTRNQGDN